MSYKLLFSNLKVEVLTKASITNADAAKEYANKYFRRNGHVIEVTDLKTKVKTTFED